MAETESVRLEDRRPLSPHLFIYRPMLTTAMSIAHRITGAGLYFGTLLVAYYFVAAASGPWAYEYAKWILGSPIGLLVMFFYSWALFHHLLGGLRHAIWESGRGMDPQGRETLAMATLVGGFVLTVVVWAIALFV